MSLLEKATKFVPALAAGYGVAVAFVYFFGAIHFFPSGMNLGDTLLLMFIAFGYGALSLILIGGGLLLATPGQAYLSGLHRGIGSDIPPSGAERFPWWSLGGVAAPLLIGGLMGLLYPNASDDPDSITPEILTRISAVLLIVSVALTYFARQHGSTSGAKEADICKLNATSGTSLKKWETAADLVVQVTMYWMALLVSSLAILIFGMTGALAVTIVGSTGVLVLLVLVPMQRKSQSGMQRDRAVVRIVVLLYALGFVPLFLDGSQFKMGMASKVMEALGLRTLHATVHASGSALRDLVEVANSSELPLRICKTDDGSAQVGPVDVLWHGLGTRSLISLKGKQELQVPTEQVSVIRGLNAMCHDLTQAVNFASGKDIPVDVEQLRRLTDEIRLTIAPSNGSKIDDWDLQRIVITGNSDPMPVSDAGNERLAKTRGEIVAKYLTDDPLLSDRVRAKGTSIVVAAQGSRRSIKSDCPLTGEQRVLAECHSANRRATVRLIFAPPRKLPAHDGARASSNLPKDTLHNPRANQLSQGLKS